MGASDTPPAAMAMAALMTEIRDRAKVGDRRADLVLRVVREALARGILAPGVRLPTEIEIAAALGISRTPVREAMRVLQTIGLVEIRPGAGTVVRADVSGSLAELLLFETHLQGASLDALTEVRRIFERTCAELAAERATDDDLALMREAIDRLDRLARTPGARIEELAAADAAFHRAVYRATHNPLIESLARTGAAESVVLHRREYALIASRQGSKIRGNALSDEADRGINHWLASLK